MWKRGVKVTPPSKAFLDPNQYLPKFAKELLNDFLSSDSKNKSSWKQIQQLVRRKKPFMASMLVYGVHQCSGKDKFRECQMLLDLVRSDDVRQNIVNTPYGRKGYTALHRACYYGSERLLKWLVCCGANVNVVSPEGETLLEVMKQGLDQQQKESQYTLAKILNYSPKSQFYKVRMPNGKIAQFSSTLIDHHRKWVQTGHVYVHTPGRKDDFMFIRERFRLCEKYIREKQKFDDKQMVAATKKKKKRKLFKPQAAQIIQQWWKGFQKTTSNNARTKQYSWKEFIQGKRLKTNISKKDAKVFLMALLKQGRIADITRFKTELGKTRSVFHQVINEDREVREYAMDDCPMLLKV